MNTKSGLKVSEIIDMMRLGAVFKTRSNVFTIPDCGNLEGMPRDNNNDMVSASEWREMTLKTPPTTPEYSTEFEKMEDEVMAKLMIEGKVLEVKVPDGAILHCTSNPPSDRCSYYKFYSRLSQESDLEQTEMNVSWGYPCRVYQEPKEETRYRFAYKSEQYPGGRMDGGYYLDEETFKSSKQVMVHDVQKMENYSKQFPLPCQCNGKCPKCCKDQG